MTEEQYRTRWMKRHRRYERESYRLFSNALKEIVLAIPFNMLTTSNYEIVVQTSVAKEPIQNAYNDVYSKIGIAEGKVVGKEINEQLKNFQLDTFLSQFTRTLRDWLLLNADSRVNLVRQSYIDYINEYIKQGIANGQSIDDIVNALEKEVKKRGWYRWQLMRIARTESTAAANHGSQTAATISGVLTDKVWISAQDARTRRPPKSQYNHLAMNGVKVAMNEKFNVNGDEIMFPGDPKGAAGNIINCRCTIGRVVRRDRNGRIIRA